MAVKGAFDEAAILLQNAANAFEEKIPFKVLDKRRKTFFALTEIDEKDSDVLAAITAINSGFIQWDEGSVYVKATRCEMATLLLNRSIGKRQEVLLPCRRLNIKPRPCRNACFHERRAQVMKVVTLKIPISQSIYDTAKFAVEEGVARSEEEFLARIALKGIFSDLFEDVQPHLDDYLDEMVNNVYPEELAGEERRTV